MYRRNCFINQANNVLCFYVWLFEQNVSRHRPTVCLEKFCSNTARQFTEETTVVSAGMVVSYGPQIMLVLTNLTSHGERLF